MNRFGSLIYSPETVSSEALKKKESHAPKIKAPDTVKSGEVFEVEVFVGSHPSSIEHSIRWIEVYFYEEGRGFNPVHLATITFTPEYVEPSVKINLKLRKSGVLYVLGYCNLHGIWESRKEIKVVS